MASRKSHEAGIRSRAAESLIASVVGQNAEELLNSAEARSEVIGAQIEELASEMADLQRLMGGLRLAVYGGNGTATVPANGPQVIGGSGQWSNSGSNLGTITFTLHGPITTTT
jgi:hypothetical protein